MYIIGLTGGIACGKSAVSRLLAAKGVPIVDADVVSRQLVEPGAPLLGRLADCFGDGILRGDGSLDRGRLGRLVFARGDLLQQLNEIMHPAIWRECLRQLADYRQERVAVLVAPLLYEHGAESWVQAVWVVACSKTLQMQRLMERDGLSEAEARSRIQTQMAVERKLERADYALMNDGSRDDLARAVEDAWELWQEKIVAFAGVPGGGVD